MVEGHKFKDKKPFYRTNLESVKRDQVTVELNPLDRARVERLKILLNIKSDAKIIRIALEAGENAMHGTLSASTWRYIASTERQRLSNFVKLPEPEGEENATQK